MKRKILFYFILLAILSCKKSANVENVNIEVERKVVNLDSINQTNNKTIEISGSDINKLVISKEDSLIWITPDKYSDERIFGYESPNLNSKKVILISSFTNDVENNPFDLPLGSYYELDNDHRIKFQKLDNGFINAKFILNDKEIDDVYFEKKWVEFEND